MPRRCCANPLSPSCASVAYPVVAQAAVLKATAEAVAAVPGLEPRLGRLSLGVGSRHGRDDGDEEGEGVSELHLDRLGWAGGDLLGLLAICFVVVADGVGMLRFEGRKASFLYFFPIPDWPRCFGPLGLLIPVETDEVQDRVPPSQASSDMLL